MAAAAAAGERLSPFTGVRFDGDTPLVEFEDDWYELLKLDGLKAADLVAHCRRAYGGKWEKRFAEDLPEVLAGMGKRAGRTARLVLRSRDTGEERTVAEAPMTGENRRKVWEARQAQDRFDPAGDMKALRDFLEQNHSYRFRFPGSLDRFAWTGGAVDRNAFAVEVAKRLAMFGDGHTRVRGRWDWLPRGYAPFTAAAAGRRLVALRKGGDGLLDGAHPYLRSLDGVAVDEWVAAARPLVGAGSPEHRLWTAAEVLDFLAYLRAELGREAAPDVAVELESEDGRKARTLRLPLDPRPGPPARLAAGRVPGPFGYLRIAEMSGDRAFLADLLRQMEGLRGTKGLVIDVRGNGGGSRDAVRVLLPHLLDAPRVVNVAKYRLPDAERPESPQGHLDDRFLYPATWSRWTAEERAAVEAFAKAFRPEWEPPADAFTQWHYMVVGPSKEAFRYEAPVVVLMDAHCFSAADILLGALKGVPGVTLVGTRSGGASGRSKEIALPGSGLRVRVSSMASFQPDGRLYDGNGVEPDVVAEPTATDWTGATDTMLDAALKRLRGNADGKR